MKYIIKILLGALNIIYAGIKLFPVKNKITIVSRQSNEKSLDIRMIEEEIKRQEPNVQVEVLCRFMGESFIKKCSYIFHLLRQMWHIGTSKIVVTDSYCIGISVLKQRKSLKVVQMWHALGALKKFGFSIAGNGGEGKSKDIADCMKMHKNYTNIIVSSQQCKEPYKEAFGYGNVEMNVESLPRVDALLSEKFKKNSEGRIYGKYPELKEKEIILYAPTFRAKKDITKEINELANIIDTDKYVFVVKKHPLMEAIKEKKGILVDEEFSTMEMILVADYVVCDYSAIVFEAAIIEKPLFFYSFDLEDYEGKRDFYLDYKNEMPGKICKKAKEVVKAIEGKDYSLEKVREFANKYVEKRSGCTKELVKKILK